MFAIFTSVVSALGDQLLKPKDILHAGRFDALSIVEPKVRLV
jgi:hypothetical protein